MPPNPLTNFEKMKCYQSEPKFKGVYSSNSLPKRKYRAYIPNLDW